MTALGGNRLLMEEHMPQTIRVSSFGWDGAGDVENFLDLCNKRNVFATAAEGILL